MEYVQFLVTYANIDNWSPSLAKIEKEKLSVLDKWILLRLEELVNDVTKNLDSYNATSATLLIENFVDDLSNWYIRRSRDRVGSWADDKESKSAFYTTIYTVMENLIRIIAPFLPFLSEEIYRNITKKESVHLEDWPDISFPFLKEEKNLIENMAYLRSVVEKIHAKRKELNIPVRQPLLEVTFGSPDKKFEDISDDLIKIAQDELNVKSLIFKFSKEESIELNTKITPELEEEAKARELLRMVQEERKKMNISFTQPSVIYSPWQPKDKKLLETILRKALLRK